MIRKNIHGIIPKRQRLVPKRPNINKVANPVKMMLKSIDVFRRRRLFNRFMKVKPFSDYFKSAKQKIDFEKFCKEMENFRYDILGMNMNRFYKLIPEFLLVPNQRAYYNVSHLFGCIGSYEAEEFENRIYKIFPYICRVIGEDDHEMETIEFYDKLMEFKRFGGERVTYKSKDWYVTEAIRQEVISRGWLVEETLRRIKHYYRMRTKKVYPETILVDLIHGEFDGLEKIEKLKNKSKVPSFEKEDWYNNWLKEGKELEEKRKKHSL